jgi:hypothetical protein
VTRSSASTRRGAHRAPPCRPQQLRARHGAQLRFRGSPRVAGIPRRRVLETKALDVVMGMAFSLMASYAAKLTRPPLDEFLKPLVWTR